ncbi:ring-cleaving dioxygenase [Cytophagaceae bacterium YF14B1]|uniref:Ring-cleaving dioxygenase n=1 Tax=Xanthocytophaga flava TaxID=3048013 RepID=A0AAE3UDT3_9BACT|nr:ring-cleaving dioxygenase [Xanthocytophaga flavus]MDJ1486079.1 ring-cleaving dioxygenase [Xanthocytophaga flavus]
MKTLINGLHHVTAFASSAQKNVDFYVGVLGLRLVKKTINFDAPEVYHLYYGDEIGHAGTIMTFFPYKGMVRGRKGAHQLTYTSFSIPENALDFWMNRLNRFHITFEKPASRFDETYIQFEDPDGTGIELVATKNDTRPGWSNGSIPLDKSIRGFHTVTLHENQADKTVELLTETMQHQLVVQEGNRIRLEAGKGGSGNLVDILFSPTDLKGLQGAGTVHHVAFSTDNEATQLEIREKLLLANIHPTTVQDRNYFRSIYFREPGGVLFEVATNVPGFAVDEDVTALGQHLKLPEWYEPRRSEIEKHLDPIEIKAYS